jgi:RNA polymerase sigma-70 factor (ECF subfamily)
MQSAQHGDKEAFRTLLQEVRPVIARFLQRRIPDQLELEDACQETLIAIYESRRTYDARRPVEPWLYAIARNVGANHARQHYARAWQEPDDESYDQLIDGDAAARAKLKQALGQLSQLQLEAIRLTKIEGLSLDEAAERSGTTVGALKVRVHRAFEFIRRALLD